jgi:hypothetical protein
MFTGSAVTSVLNSHLPAMDVAACLSFIKMHENRPKDFVFCITEHLTLSGLYWGLNTCVCCDDGGVMMMSELYSILFAVPSLMATQTLLGSPHVLDAQAIRARIDACKCSNGGMDLV